MTDENRKILHGILDDVLDIISAGENADFHYMATASSCTVLIGNDDNMKLCYGYEDLPFSETFEDLAKEISARKGALYE